GWPLPRRLLRAAKAAGLADAQLAALAGRTEAEVRRLRVEQGVRPTMKAVDTCAAEFAARTPYFYSTYEEEDEATHDPRPTVVILGSGPNRIGQGVEFDSCCVQASLALRAAGYRVVMVNSNPETVSTDYDISDRLYFEPLVLENVLEILARERPLGVIVQLGGQTPLGLAAPLAACGVPLLGTSLDAIDRAENRERIKEVAAALGILYPPSRSVTERGAAVAAAHELGFPLLVRPSYVLGGRGMRIVVDDAELAALLDDRSIEISPDRPLMLDQYLEDAVEIDVDAVADGTHVMVGPVMEHIEEAGVHSGDSSCVTPPFSLGGEMLGALRAHTRSLARALEVKGLLNVQFAVKGERIYVLEVNPRASRTVPFVSKATGVPLARLAAEVMVGRTLAEIVARRPAPATTDGAATPPDDAPTLPPDLEPDADLEPRAICVKKPVYPFDRFPGEDTVLGPEMKSTGEVMGIDRDLGRAFAKALIADGGELPRSGGVFLSVRDRDKRAVVFIARRLADLGFELHATDGTARLLAMNGMRVTRVHKVREEGGPDAVDLIRGGVIRLVINTPLGRPSRYDERAIRLAAVERGVLTLTTIPGAAAAVQAIEAARADDFEVMPLQDLPIAAPV
ncbi:MAG: carbamoyl-phosphate synthase large subunit, partial [Candidatus Eiseniibacteriota bacterium]